MENKDLYFFTFMKENYVFSAYNHKVIALDVKSYLALKENKVNVTEESGENEILLENIYGNKISFQEYNEPKCFVTINYSTKCDLNCTYCFRNKKNSMRLTINDLENIIQFAMSEYRPDSNEYVFSLGFTSEPLLDIALLKQFDSMLAKYEGYLFTKDSFCSITPRELFLSLPVEIKNNYSVDSDDDKTIEVLNNILLHERLYNYYKIKDGYFQDLLGFTNTLSVSRTVQINRILLNERFEGKLKKEMKILSMFFISNGTILNKEIVDFIKGLNIRQFTISIDGPKKINDFSRKYSSGRGSYHTIISNIKEFRRNNITIIASSVITAQYPYPYKVLKALRKKGIKYVTFHLVRGYKDFSFKTMKTVNEELGKIYKQICNDSKKNKFDLLISIKYSFLIDPLKLLLNQTYVTQRCNWGQQVVIDNNGDIYHCDYTCGKNEDCLGNLYKNIDIQKISDRKNVDEEESCCNCWARHLCGGMCYYEQLYNKENNKFECIFRKAVIQNCLNLYVFFRKKDLLEKIKLYLN
jgi:radical SAM protein with 4Fe4S-binding SPASM domain